MKSQSKINFSLAILSLVSMFGFSTIANADPVPNYGVICNTSNYPYPTVEAWKSKPDGNRVTAAMIRLKTDEFGEDATPLNRCKSVAYKLNEAVVRNKGFDSLRLTTGPLNGRVVVCSLDKKFNDIDCNGRNMLFTLKRENERIAGRILGQLMNIGVYGTGTINEDSGEQVVIDLGEWAKQNLTDSGQPNSQINQPSSTEAPSSTPAPASGW